jgi:hypothetical protein
VLDSIVSLWQLTSYARYRKPPTELQFAATRKKINAAAAAQMKADDTKQRRNG